ncbi:MAG: hypothetical protein HRT58_06510 [Crocinitomicaceae bacterium]|nr:hypothetical protein [Flavobacteriales bacterium]NQZ35297.1 hypothetical protein [Crocinitomicaceae bacterium]
MDKTLTLLALLLFSQLATAQEVKFTDGQYQNGLTYPIAEYSVSSEAETTLNNNILNIVSNYEEQDYCIGQYGYVQQTRFIQLHFYFNCMDMDESKNEFYLFSLDDGEPCPTSEMFLDKQKKHYRPFFSERIVSHYTENGKEAPSDELMKSLSIDDYIVKLLEKGIEISLPNDENWPSTNLIVSWVEIQPFLKTNFI